VGGRVVARRSHQARLKGGGALAFVGRRIAEKASVERAKKTEEGRGARAISKKKHPPNANPSRRDKPRLILTFDNKVPR